MPYKSYGNKKKTEYKNQKMIAELGIYFVIATLVGAFILVISR